MAATAQDAPLDPWQLHHSTQHRAHLQSASPRHGPCMIQRPNGSSGAEGRTRAIAKSVLIPVTMAAMPTDFHIGLFQAPEWFPFQASHPPASDTHLLFDTQAAERRNSTLYCSSSWAIGVPFSIKSRSKSNSIGSVSRRCCNNSLSRAGVSQRNGANAAAVTIQGLIKLAVALA